MMIIYTLIYSTLIYVSLSDSIYHFTVNKDFYKLKNQSQISIKIEESIMKLVIDDEVINSPTFSTNQMLIKYTNQKCFRRARIMTKKEYTGELYVCSGITGYLRSGCEIFDIFPLGNVKNKIQHRIDYVTDSCASLGGTYIYQDIKNNEKHLDIPMERQRNDQVYKHELQLSVVIPNVMFKDPQIFDEYIERAELFGIRVVLLSQYFFDIFNIKIVLKHIDVQTVFVEANDLTQNYDDEEAILTAMKLREELMLKELAYDLTLLFSPFIHSGSTGLSFGDQLCGYNSSVIIVAYTKPEWAVSTLAHEIGHLLGIAHSNKNTDDCDCFGKMCMMDTKVHRVHFKQISWSDCEIRYLKNKMLYTPPSCIRLYNQNNRSQMCGNGVIDDGEDCDCGPRWNCIDKSIDTCCDALTCKLSTDAECAAGNCCKNCKIMSATSSCRHELNECTIGQCDGESNYCYSSIQKSEEIFSCNYGLDTCFNNMCIPKNSICQKMFGSKSIFAPDDCFVYFNAKGTQLGNCRLKTPDDSAVYENCVYENSLCGKIICKDFKILNLSLLYRHRGHCITVDNIDSQDNIDSFFVNNGIQCGDNKVCYDRKCIYINDAISASNNDLCGFYGNIAINQSCICVGEDVIKIGDLCYLQEYYSRNTKIFICSLLMIFNVYTLYILLQSCRRRSKYTQTNILY